MADKCNKCIGNYCEVCFDFNAFNPILTKKEMKNMGEDLID